MDDKQFDAEIRWLRRTLEGNGLVGLIEQVRLNTKVLTDHDAKVARVEAAEKAARRSTAAVILSGLALVAMIVGVIL